ncbi:MAG: hypothetical protein EP329_25880 [Deltaproteobacteria bacterium]|nr:MAG: hypothetical protein EP329_25880 [Deltaproteobacteria bacterium]
MSALGNTQFRDFVELVRERSDIVGVIGADVDLRESGSTLKGLSPFHPEKTPSFVVWPETRTWHDFSRGGGLGGDVFDYVQQRERVGFMHAVHLLAERAGVRRLNEDDESWAREVEQLSERREVERLHTAAAAYYHRALLPEIRETHYRQHYGFTDETVDELQLGWADGRLFEHLTTTVGASREAALKTGLFVVTRSGIKDLFQSRLVFPYWRGGRVVYFIARRTERTSEASWEQAKYKKLLTHSEKHSYVSPTVQNEYFYEEDAARGADEVLITEGVTDCISARQAGVRCISPVTIQFRIKDVPRLLKLTQRARRVVICNDSEANGSGEAGARATAAAFWDAGREIYIATIPRPEDREKIDVNELVATGSPEALQEVMANALPYPEYLLAAIPQDTPPHELDSELTPVLAALERCSAIRTGAVLDAITQRFGIKKRALNASLKAVRGQSRGQATPAPSAPGQRPKIVVGDRQLREVLNETRDVLTAANARRIDAAASAPFENVAAPLFVHGRSLVRLDRPTDGAATVVAVTEDAMHGVLAREADWIEQNQHGERAVPPPKDVSKDLLAYPPAGLATVDTVLTTPVFGRAGGILSAPGLHASDQLWLETDPTLLLAEVSEKPSAAEIDAAKAIFVDDLFVDFPFVSQADRAHAIAAVLQTFMRRLIDGPTPLYVVESPTAGTGKGLLCNLVSVVVTGTICAARTLPSEDDEIRKMITSELGRAQPIILLDNAREHKRIAAPSLAAVLTTTKWTDRLLGRTRMLTHPNHALWMLTGNNPSLAVDVARRSIPIRIDAARDRPWMGRTYKHKPITGWAKEHRSELVHAALTLIQAWIAAGRPRLPSADLGSFEEWAVQMAGLLDVCGIDGFLGNLDDMYATADIEGDAWRQFTSAWWESHGSTPVTVSSLNTLCETNDMMASVRGEGGSRSQQTRLGRALHDARDRVYGVLRIAAMPRDRNNRAIYALQPIGDGDDA